MIKTMCKSNARGDMATAAVGVPATGVATATSTPIASITCYKCGNLGHYSTTCQEPSASAKKFERRGQMRCYSCQGYRNMARNCPKAAKKKEDATPAENVRVVQGPETRQMKEHPVYLNAYLGKRGVSFLVDTGCEQWVTPKRLNGDSRIEQAECRLFASNGTVINVIGEVTMDIRIGELVLPTRFVLSDNITEPMLRVEWLRCNQMTWDFAQDILIIGDKIHHLIPGEGGGFCRRVVATEKVTIPPRSQAIVPGRVEMSRMQGDSDGGVWTTEVSELKNRVNVARAILLEKLDDLPILVLNSSTEPCEINSDTILTELTLAKCTKKNDENELTAEEGDRWYKHLSKLMEGSMSGCPKNSV